MRLTEIKDKRDEKFAVATGQIFKKRILSIKFHVSTDYVGDFCPQRARFIVADCFGGLGLHGVVLWVNDTDFSQVRNMYAITHVAQGTRVSSFSSNDIASANRILVEISKLQNWKAPMKKLRFDKDIKLKIIGIVERHTNRKPMFPRS